MFRDYLLLATWLVFTARDLAKLETQKLSIILAQTHGLKIIGGVKPECPVWSAGNLDAAQSLIRPELRSEPRAACVAAS